MSIELRPLRHFLALVEHGSFARAAIALRLSQPALTRSIQSLERLVGSELVFRSPGGVVPTDVGHVLRLRARELLQFAEDLDRDVLHGSNVQSGHVAVGAGPYPAETIFVPALTRFIDAHPMIKIRLQVRSWDELLVRLRGRELDFFVAELSTLEREPDLEVQPLGAHPLYYVARARHLLAHERHRRPAAMFAYPLVAMSRIPPRILQPMLTAQRQSGDTITAGRPFPALDSATLAGLKQMLANSDAIAVLPLTCVQAEFKRGEIAVLGSEPWLVLNYGVVRLKSHPLSPAANRLVEFLHEAEQAVSADEQALLSRLAPRPARRAARSSTPRAQR
jgi:DNA-binding transcriptional LysR family regulator